MKRMTMAITVAFLFMTLEVTAQVTAYNAVPSPLPPNYPSQGFQCCATAEIGDEVILAPGTPRVAGFATVGMSSWAKHSDYPSMSPTGYMHPITLNIYADVASAAAHLPMGMVTQSFLIPWRPEPTPTCGTAWKAGNGSCYNGFAFPITFDLRQAGSGSTPLVLPNSLIYGVAFNTNTWGYNPIGLPGPYESLNVGLNVNPPTVGTNVELDALYVNYSHAPFYTDSGAGGVGIFRRDTAWTPYTPAVEITTFAFAANGNDCKSGGWQSLVRSDFTPFKSQGDCVSYTQTGK